MALTATSARPHPRATPILMYHQVTPRPLAAFRKYAVTPRAFAAQMRCLSVAGYRPVALDVALRRPWLGPRRPVVLTFDDGYQDCVDYAVPILRQHGFRATFYLVAGLMGETSRWLMAERGIELPMMSWPTARALEAEGFDCGSHSMSHPRLAALSARDCHRELLDSRRLLEHELGHAVRDLAYPFGSFDQQVRTIAAETGYRSACSVRIGLSDAADDVLALHRVPVNGQDSLLDFVWKLRTGRGVREWLRARRRGRPGQGGSRA